MVAVGYETLAENVTGSNCTALGFQALRNSTVSYNTALGDSVLTACTTGTMNTGAGFRCLNAGTTGVSNNCGYGVDCLANCDSAQNCGYGQDALRFLTTGGTNCAFGRQAGDTLTTGSNCSFFGFDADVDSVSASYRTVIGSGAVGLVDNTVQLGRASNDDVVIGKSLLFSANAATIGASGVCPKLNYSTYTQTTNNTTGVTVTTSTGLITMFGNLTTAASSKSATFTVTIPVSNAVFKVWVATYSGTGEPIAIVRKITATTWTIAAYNISTGSALNNTITWAYECV